MRWIVALLAVLSAGLASASFAEAGSRSRESSPGVHLVRVRAGAPASMESLGLHPLSRLHYGPFLWLELAAADLQRLRDSGISFEERIEPFRLRLGGQSFDPLAGSPGSTGTTDAYGFLRGLGQAPGASLVEQVYSPWFLNPGGMLLLMTDSYNSGALLSGNSWGPAGTPRGYDNDTMQVDIGTRDADPNAPGNQPLLFVLSFMNGTGGTSTQGTPDEARNIFNIGSTKMQTLGGAQILEIDDLSSNTAHGPALIRAAFMAVAHDQAGHLDADGGVLGHPFDSKQGWGRMDLEAVVDAQVSVRYFDAPQLLDDTGEEWQITLSPMDPTEPMRLMLVWTDAPGHGLGSTPAWNKDLDLIVEGPAGTYLGNRFGAGGWSVTGGVAALPRS
ncbi:MAG: hypothetical protein ACE5GW_01010 [Planctomycetota bacterium]